MDTQASQSPEPDGGASYLEDVEQPSGSMVMALVWGLAVAFLGGMLWAAIAVFGNMEIGWLAWGLGAGIGAVMAWAMKGKGSTELAVAAVLISLIGLASGKVLTYEFGTVPEQAKLIVQNKETHPYLALMHLKASGRYSKPLFDWVTSADSLENPPEELKAELSKLQDEVRALLAGSDQGFLQQQSPALARAGMAEASLADRYGLGGFDLLWIFLAVGTAWRLTMGQRQPQPVRRRHTRGPTGS